MCLAPEPPFFTSKKVTKIHRRGDRESSVGQGQHLPLRSWRSNPRPPPMQQASEMLHRPMQQADATDATPSSREAKTTLAGENITKGFIERWVREQEAASERQQHRRHRMIVTWTVIAAVAGIVAAVAGIIAAWPVIKDW
jgi:hypothetical protein